MIAKLKSLFTVLQKGQCVADAAGQKNKAAIVMAVTAFLVSVKAASSAFGVELGVTDSQIEQAVYGAAPIVGLVWGLWSTFATSDKVGIGAVMGEFSKQLMQNPAKRAEFIYGQPMSSCPDCGSYNMKPQTPIKIELDGSETTRQLLGKYARATLAGETTLEGPCYYMCGDCGHKGPSVDCTGRTSEDVHRDPVVNAEMKRLWNTQAGGKHE